MGPRRTRPVAVDAQTLARLIMGALKVADAERACPLCGATSFEVVGIRDRNGDDLRTVLCKSCGHVFTNPAPSIGDLAAYYADKYRAEYKGVTTPKRKHVLRAGLRALERLERLRAFQEPPATVLDVGAGGGEFAYLLSQRGYAASGIEPNTGYATYARQIYGLNIQGATLEQANISPRSFDVVTLHHVLEHVAEPRTGLETLRGWLKDDGLLIVEVPGVMSWFHSPRRRFHAAHLHVFNQKGLEDLLTAAGFKIEDAAIAPNTEHVNIVARKIPAPMSASPRNAAPEVRANLRRHTALAHFVSGMALKRFWSNLKRPWREARQLRALGEPEGRAILDRLYQEAAS